MWNLEEVSLMETEQNGSSPGWGGVGMWVRGCQLSVTGRMGSVIESGWRVQSVIQSRAPGSWQEVDLRCSHHTRGGDGGGDGHVD